MADDPNKIYSGSAMNPPPDNNTIRLFLWDVPSPENDELDETARGEVALINWTEGIPDMVILATGFPDSPTFFRDLKSDVLRYTRMIGVKQNDKER